MSSPNAKSIPGIEIYARPIGKFNWGCPNCGQEYPLRNVPWRRLEVHCQRCKSKYQLGLGFSQFKTPPAFILGKWNGATANRFNPIGTAYSGAQLYGSVEFACPDCQTPQSSFLNHESVLQCNNCANQYFISLLFYRIPRVGKTTKLKTPLDCIVRDLKNVKTEDIQPLDPPQDNQIPGPSSSSLGGDC